MFCGGLVPPGKRCGSFIAAIENINIKFKIIYLWIRAVLSTMRWFVFDEPWR